MVIGNTVIIDRVILLF